ncbi:metallophosphoesterase [Clostridium ganghwense]|uniref:Metallophosphoesterase n=1 Tax=Clostridium ganghwense TaxID=312089 RepID=A0ABT4CLE2_9CLOT|nr:metallophosphoesterase [Clostridium ganghwense]MCY6369298.1 metallophosphoesterase [Clostridium ganghwense]
MSTFKCLTKVFKSSKEIFIDDLSKFILISDCHRGDNSWTDDFANNENILFTALNYYYEHDFTYIEIGDGDELWENRKFSEIRQTHSPIFWLMSKFYNDKRLYMIWGNHDIVKKNKKYVQKNLYYYYDERKEKYKPLFDKIEVYEGLILKYLSTKNKIFIVHGHQGDLINDQLWRLSRFLIRYIWRPLTLHLGVKDPTSPAKNYKKKKITEKNIIKWVKANNQMVIAGHTHRPMFPDVGEPPYFNDGSCVHPRCITGIEIQNGKIMLVKWSVKTKNDGTLYVEREIISGPKKLQSFFIYS